MISSRFSAFLPVLSGTVILAAFCSPLLAAEIRLMRGEKVRIPYDNVQKIIVEDEGIADVRVNYDDRKIEIQGKEPGETDITFQAPEGGKTHLQVKVTERKKGSKRSSGTGKRDPAEALRNIESEIRSQVKDPRIQVEAEQGKITLRGTVFDAGTRANLEKLASAFGKPVINLIQISHPMIEMDLKIVQIERTEGENYGDNLLKNLGISSDSVSGTGLKPHLSLSTQVQSSLNLLIHHGSAKILSEPHLSCRTGEHATFHSGGEIGFRVSGVGHASVRFKEYGLILQIEPNIVEEDKIESRIQIEISAPTNSPTSPQDIGFTKFNADSHLISRPDETIIIAGLAENIEHHFQEQTPLLGNIPVLSLFFSSRQNEQSKRDLLLMVTPTFSRIDRLESYQALSVEQRNRDEADEEANPEEGESDAVP